MKKAHYFVIIFLILILGVTFPLLSQSSETILTIALPDWYKEAFSQTIFDDFSARHPGVKVVVVSTNPSFFSLYNADSDAISQNIEALVTRVSTADIHLVQNYDFNIEATRTGAYLDLRPLIEGDFDFDIFDFFPAVWSSYHWDHGIWAVPLSFSPVMLIYNPMAFDEAGIAYPNPEWTIDDLAYAARVLTKYKDNGEVSGPGLTGYQSGHLIVSLAGHSLLDRSTLPHEPNFNSQQLNEVYEIWQQLVDEGVYQIGGNLDVPMKVGEIGELFLGGETKWKSSLLPGGHAGLNVQGLAVNASTSHPELAYELVKYLTTSPEFSTLQYSSIPARRSMIGVDKTSSSIMNVDDETRDVAIEAVEYGIPVSEMQLFNYISFMLQPDSNPEGAATSLEEAQSMAESILKQIPEIGLNDSQLIVTIPQPTPIIAPGQSVMTFRLVVPFSPLPNEAAWKEYVADFISNEPTISNVDLITGFNISNTSEPDPDCWYDQFNTLANIDLGTILSLDPFMDSDGSFNKTEIFPGVLAQVQSENQTWAFPIALQPTMLILNRDIFEREDIPVPEHGWTIEQFVQILRDLDRTGNYEYPFQPHYSPITYLHLLIQAFGGKPVDYSTTPHTYNLTDPATIEAIQQTLDLAKEGLINYQPVGNVSSSVGFWHESDKVPISVTTFTNLILMSSLRLSNNDTLSFVDNIEYVLFPSGMQYTPVSYTLSAGYINVNAQNPEACYRFISGIAQQPELFLGIPIHQSQFNDPALTIVLGENLKNLLDHVAKRLNAPNISFVHDPDGTFYNYITQIWIGTAFDRYVLENADLDIELAEAERIIIEYHECLGLEESLPDVMSMTEQEISKLYERYIDCAIAVDPSLNSVFSSR